MTNENDIIEEIANTLIRRHPRFREAMDCIDKLKMPEMRIKENKAVKEIARKMARQLVNECYKLD